MKCFLYLFAIMALVFSPILQAAQPSPSPIPLEKGVQWIYEARIAWTPVASGGLTGIQSNSFKWTAEIVDYVEGKSAQAAVVHAWPDEIAGMDPAQPKGYEVLAVTSNRMYHVHAKNKTTAIRLARDYATHPNKLATSAEIYFMLPLAKGQRWDEMPDQPKPRDDGWYCWHVESMTNEVIRIQSLTNKQATVYTVAYRTNPDHQIIRVAPGIGILEFEYDHHGTVAFSNVRLIEMKRPVNISR